MRSELFKRVSGWLGGLLYSAIFRFERRVKGQLFGCQMCGQCVLRYTGFVCPRRCPKQLNNGPCGGSINGMCEVIPEMRCVWVEIYERSRLLGPLPALEHELPPIDWRLVGTSSWINHLTGRDAHLFQFWRQEAKAKEQSPLQPMPLTAGIRAPLQADGAALAKTGIQRDAA